MCSRHWFERLGAGLSALGFAVVALVAFTLVTVGGGSSALAQDDLPTEPAATTAPAPAAAPATSGAKPEAPPAGNQQSVLAFYYEALGLKYVVIFLGLSFLFVALMVMNFLALRRDSIVPVSLVEGFEAHLNEKNYQAAYELAKTDESFLGHVLSAGLAKLSTGYQPAAEAMEEVGEDEHMKLEQRLSYVALIGTLAPMFGLLGTVDGMVASFQVIANSPTQPKPADLAKGISQALITTLVGLWLAIPAIAFFGYYRNRLNKLIFDAGVISEGLMGRFATVGGAKK